MANVSYIQVLRKCNQKCIFCSNPENDNVLFYDEVTRILDKYKKKGIKEVIFTGGEPTLHADLSKIIIYANHLGFVCRIITNGQRISAKKYLQELVDAGLRKFHVSFYSYKPEIQNYLTQNKKSFVNLIKALTNLVDFDVQVTINTVINKFNADHLDKNILFLLKKFPYIKHFVFNNCDPYLNRASENKFVIPRLRDFKESLIRALKILQLAKKTFRIEKVPLCYIADFAEFSTETRKIVKKENRLIYFLDQRGYDDQPANKFRYPKQKECQGCSLISICAGLQGANTYYDPAELIPQKNDPQMIINKILNDPEK